MKRDWKIIRLILEQAEKENLVEFSRQGNFPEGIDENKFLAHVELLADAGILRNVDVTRNVNSGIVCCEMNCVFITMEGHDLLDALRDTNVWTRIKEKALRAGVSISWEFIKAAIPAVMKELCR